MKNKRGQLTVFMILGIVLIIIFGLLLYLRSTNTEERIENELRKGAANVEAIKLYVDLCIKKTAVDGAYHIAEHGGYYKDNLLEQENKFSVLSQDHNFLMPIIWKPDNSIDYISAGDMETQYEDFIVNEIDDCVKEFEIFPDFDVKKGDSSAEVEIEDHEVIVEVNYPLTIKKGDMVTKVDKFPKVNVPVRIGWIRDEIISELLTIAEERGPRIHISYLLSLAPSMINVIPGSDESTLYYVINDKNSSIQRGMLVLHPDASNRQFLFNVALDFG